MTLRNTAHLSAFPPPTHTYLGTSQCPGAHAGLRAKPAATFTDPMSPRIVLQGSHLEKWGLDTWLVAGLADWASTQDLVGRGLKPAPTPVPQFPHV